MYPSPLRHALPACFLGLAAACGGGGSGGSAGRPTDVTFLSFNTIQANQRANMNGISQTASGTVTPGLANQFTVDSTSLDPLDTANSRATLTLDGNRNLSAMTFTAPQSSAAFTSGIDCSSGPTCIAQTATSIGILGNPANFGWNYQSYGVWLNRPTPTTFQAGAISAGAATPAAAVPTTGNASFTGFASGFYVNEVGVPHRSSANVSANVDWVTRNIQFSTNTTTINNLNSGTVTLEPGLNLSGTLSYGAGSNQFTGNVSATTNLLTGSATGRFYGPSAQEMGGVYGLQGNAGSSLIGAFGARRP